MSFRRRIRMEKEKKEMEIRAEDPFMTEAIKEALEGIGRIMLW